MIRYLLRTGYVLRRVDEALGEEPLAPGQLDRNAAGERWRTPRSSGERRKRKRWAPDRA